MTIRIALSVVLGILASAPTVAVAADRTAGKMASQTLGCQNEKVLMRAFLMAESEPQAGVRYGLRNGCRILDAGTAINLEDVSVWNGFSCVRPRGAETCLWVGVDYVKFDN